MSFLGSGVVALAYAGMAALALATERHRKQLLPRTQAWRPWLRAGLRATGAALLILSLLGCVALQGTATGLIGWTGVLTVGALLMMAQISYRQTRRRRKRTAALRQ